MGKTDRLGPATAVLEALPLASRSSKRSDQPVLVSGSDLYRLNCRGCHREAGEGAPPEINSVINPVRATSPLAVMARMKASGFDIQRSDATKLAAQARHSLLARLHNGGQDMPPFQHLSDGEIRSLVLELENLAGLGGEKTLRIKETRLRIGELLVKSTCHVCHSAAGPDPTAAELANGAIPPLSTLTTRTTSAGFVRKVTQGAPIMMGAPPLLCRGRMPVFDYITEEEAADAYLYLSVYRPDDLPPDTLLVSSTPRGAPGSSPAIASAGAATQIPAALNQVSEEPEPEPILMVAVPGLLSLLLLGGGVAFTVRECVRASGVARMEPQERLLKGNRTLTHRW
jgi:mono/diheme cytochrome c family protein